MKNQKGVGLTIVLVFLGTIVFADMVGPDGRYAGPRWPEQKIQFLNITSLGKYKLHLQIYNKYDNTVYNDIVITKDTAYFEPEHGGSPSPNLRIFALTNKKSTDKVEITDTDVEFNFIGIKNNRLQFTKKPKKGFLSTIGDLNDTDNTSNSFKTVALNGMNKLLIGLSLTAFAGLYYLFTYYKKKSFLNMNGDISV